MPMTIQRFEKFRYLIPLLLVEIRQSIIGRNAGGTNRTILAKKAKSV